MEKTKLGISVGLFGAFIYVAAMFGGYVAAILLAGYVLLMESNEWLKKTSVKALVVLSCFSFASLLIGVVPDVFDWFASAINVFGADLYFSFINGIFGVVSQLISILKDIVFIVLIYKAFNQGTMKLPVVDNLINKYM